MRIYVAGPMRGYPQHNFPAFDEAAARLRQLGHDVVNPADLDRAVGFDGHGEFDESLVPGALRRDVAAIATCDAVALLPGWQRSQGVALELAVARAIGCAVLDAATVEPMRATIVGLSGYARAGKDTLGAILVRRYGFERVSFADILRTAALALDPIVTNTSRRLSSLVRVAGWEEAKRNPEVRSLLQRLGTEVGRNLLGPDVWVRALFDSLDPAGRYVITDCRFENEAQAVKAAGGVVVRVERPGTGAINQHVSETALDDWPFDLRVQNDGTVDDLTAAAAEVVALAEPGYCLAA